MSLLLLLTEWEPGEPPPGDSETQHLLLALQWEPGEVEPPGDSTTQHLLLALQWNPEDEPPPEPEPEPEVIQAAGGTFGFSIPPRRLPEQELEPERLTTIYGSCFVTSPPPRVLAKGRAFRGDKWNANDEDEMLGGLYGSEDL